MALNNKKQYTMLKEISYKNKPKNTASDVINDNVQNLSILNI